MTIDQALQIIESARKAIQLNGNEADLLREAVYLLKEFVKQQNK